ncbi:hypothetical protein D3C76_1711910 [compost metagenome]
MVHFNHIPADATRVDHGLDLAHLAIVFTGSHGNRVLFLERGVERLLLSVLVQPADGNDGQCIGLGIAAECHEGQAGHDCFKHVGFPFSCS